MVWRHDGAMVMSAESSTFTKKDRAEIRLELMDRFWSTTSVHDGFRLRRWATGPKNGQPKIPAGVQSMIGRGFLVVVDAGDGRPRACCPDAGFQALVAMADDPNAFPQAARSTRRYTILLEEIAKLRGTLSQNAG